MRVLFVCLGNICRSPLAEGLFKKHVEIAGLSDRIEIDSCGTSRYHIGDLPDERTRRNAIENGLRLTHRARQLVNEDFNQFDFIVAMDQSNLDNIRKLSGASAHQEIYLMRDFDTKKGSINVPDPYFGGSEGFQEVYEILDRSTKSFLRFVQSKMEE
jgi:protein-tyrosine phosphatase